MFSQKIIAALFLTPRRSAATLTGFPSVSASKLREIGIGYRSQKLKECVIAAIQARSTLDVLMTDLDVLLFDVHDTEIPDTLLQRRVNSLTLFETSQQYAQQMKTFAAARSPSPGNCVAYRSSLHNLLSREECGTLVKLLDEKRGIAQKPLIIRREDDSPGHKAQGPIIVSTLPALSQQSALLDRFRDSLLEHVCFGNTDTVFQLGDASLITFLPAGLFAQVVCSAPNYANCLEFMTRKQKHSSAVWNALFKLEVLNGGDGFAADDFLPGIAEKTAKTSRDAKFRKAGIDSDLMYGLKITPRSSVTLGDVSILTHAPEGEEDALLKFVFWMSETAKLKKKDKLSAVLQSWFPNTSLATECEAGKLSPKDFVNLFQAALPLFKDGESPFLQAFKTFTSSFEVEGEEEYFD